MMDTNNGEVIGFPVGSITYSAEKLIDFPAPDIEVVFGCNVCNSHASSQFKKSNNHLSLFSFFSAKFTLVSFC